MMEAVDKSNSFIIQTTAKTFSNSQWISVSTGKGITAFVMFTTVAIAIYLPVVIIMRFNLRNSSTAMSSTFQKWIGRFSCFAAGVFLSTGFLDIFPDVIESLDEAAKKLKMKITFPLASFFTLIGFFLMLSIEQLILIYKAYIKHNINETPRANDNEVFEKEEESRNSFLETESNNEKERIDMTCRKMDRNDVIPTITDNNNVDADADRQQKRESHEHSDILQNSNSRIFALMSAISIHAIFEGMAIGLSSTVAGVAELFIALSLHKLVIAASLGLNLAISDLKLWVKLVAGFIFSIGSPLGIGVGIVIVAQENLGNNAFFFVGGLLQGIACGTFLYVVFFEMLPHEMGHHAHADRGGKLIGVIMGFLLVCIYLLIIPEH